MIIVLMYFGLFNLENYLLRECSDSEDSFSSGSDIPAGIVEAIEGLSSKPDSSKSTNDQGAEPKQSRTTAEEDKKQKEQVIKMTTSVSSEISTNTAVVTGSGKGQWVNISPLANLILFII